MNNAKLELSYPLSPMQQGMLLHSLDEEGVYVQQMVCSLRESINVAVFVSAWQRVLERHSVLRSSFRWEDLEEPLQEVHSGLQCPFTREDWSALAPEVQQKQLDSYIKADRQLSFESTNAPLMRVALFRLADRDYRAVWTFHHALLDGRSHFLVLKEVFDIYDAYCSGQEPELKQPRPFSDYIKWLGEQDWSKAEAFWRQALRGFTAPTVLGESSDVSQAPRQRLAHPYEQIRISEVLTSQLRMLANRSEVTLNNLIQASWALLISRYTGEEDVVFGATRTCRHWTIEGAKSMVGLFINTLPLRVCVRPEQPSLSWLKELRSQHIALREYEHISLRKIQEWSEVPGGRSLFETVLVFEDYEMNRSFRTLGEQWNKRDFILLEQTNYPLVLAAYAASDIMLKLEYDERRFNRPTIERMLNHLKRLLESMVGDPDRCIAELSMLTETERQLLVKWNDTCANFPKDQCLHQLFEAQAARTPDAVALIFGERRLTYLELNNQANQLAHYLRTLGVGPEAPVGICVERSLEMVIGLLGVLKAGGAYVPLDPAYPKERLAFMLEDSQAPVLLTQHKWVAGFNQHTTRIVCLDTDWKVIARESEQNPFSQVKPENLAYVIYTSGSTGHPKGVLISHGALVSHSVSVVRHFELNPSDRVLQFASISFDVAAEELFPTLLSGATVVLLTGQAPPSIEEFIALLEKERLTVINLPSSYWHELVLELDHSRKPLFSTLRLVLTGSERVLPERLTTWRKLFGASIRWMNAYGTTEATVTATIYEPAGDDEEHETGTIPIGRPMANRQIYILDSRLKPVPVGVPGELHIGGAGLARGYLNSPDITAEKFISNPFNPEARLFRTGDRARYLPDGNIEYLGRMDHQVKVRGFRIEPGEIEAALIRHPSVRACAVVAREDEAGDTRLVAYLAPAVDKPELWPPLGEYFVYDEFGDTEEQNGVGFFPLTASDPNGLKPWGSYANNRLQTRSRQKLVLMLRRLLQEKVPEYMVPSAFVMLDELPRTPNGKVNRQALPMPELSRYELEREFVSPRDTLELQLTEIWERVLGIRPIGVNDNFFELGGHSLQGVRMFAEVERTFGKNIPLATLFQAGTIEKLADILRQDGWSAPESSLVAIQPNGPKPPFFCIHALGGNVLFYRDLARHLGPDQPFYGLRARHLNGKQVGNGSVEEMAEHYIKEIQTLQPEGPYFLGGSSFGGVAAFEMARQLHAQGHKVALLALFDAHTPDYPKLLPVTFRSDLVRRFQLHRDSLKMLNFQGRADYVMSSVARARRNLYKKLNKKYRRAGRKFYSMLKRPLPKNFIQLRDILGQVCDRYVPQVYAGKMTLFQAAKPLGIDRDPTLGWEGLAAGGLEIHEVPGDHQTILVEPHVGALAEELRRCIEKALVEGDQDIEQAQHRLGANWN